MRSVVSFLAVAAMALMLPANATAQSSLVQVIDTSQFTPPSPDAAGLAYQALTNRLLLSDSEVNEVAIYDDVNVWEITLGGGVVRTSDTTAFSNEPTGVAYNTSDGHWFFSDDDAKRVFEIDPGPDGTMDTADDVVTSLNTVDFGSSDPEGIAFDTLQGYLFIVDGGAAEIFELSPGSNGVFDGVPPDGDDVVAGQFDTASLNVNDPEGVEHNADDDTLFILDQDTKTIAHTSRSGVLIRTIDLDFLDMRNPAGITYAPGSSDPSVKNLYLADRGVDNAGDPNENDGMIYEITWPFDQPGRYAAQVGASSDDAEEGPSGSVSLNSPDLNMVVDGGDDQTIGIRFTGVTVPRDALIEDAYIQFAADETDSTTTSLTIHGEAVDDAPTFSSAPWNITSRAVTLASVAWSPPSWDLVAEQGFDQRTPDLSSVIQEIVDRPGWGTGNSLVLIITGSGERVAEAYDGRFERRPLLHIEYDPAPCHDVDGDGVTTCQGDCDDTDDQAWSIPGEVRNLAFDADKETLRWNVPQEPGGPLPLYDTIRSDDASDFVSTSSCIETSDGSDELASDDEEPSAGAVFHYLIRAKNNCGEGSVGAKSVGGDRSARSCF
jgi:uncharacterized protein YjiK